MARKDRVGRGCTRSALAVLIAVTSYAADWPTYRHDSARSGVTAERLDLPLAQSWAFKSRHAPEPAWGDPKPVPIEGIPELRRVHFDDVFHVSVAGGAAYFGSSVDGKVYCLDAATGKVRWTFFAGGPVRLAPSVWQGRVYVGSDDGFAYCLGAETGKVIWKLRPAPSNEMVLGHGKMISLWPLRTGVLVDNGVAYFGAGVFPAEGVYLCAVRADDGKVIWKNDTCGTYGAATQKQVSPQGYLLASSTTLYAPMGRVSPAAFDRGTGRLIQQSYFGKQIGGTYALLADDFLFTGTEELIATKKDLKGKFAWFEGRQLIVTRDVSYMLTDREMSALDRTTYPKVSLRRQSLSGKQSRLNRSLGWARRRHEDQTAKVKATQEKLDALDTKLTEMAEEAKGLAELKTQRGTLANTLETEKSALKSAKGELAKVHEQAQTLAAELRAVGKEMANTIKWRCPCECSESMILAGGVLFAGGKDRVIAVDAGTGKKLWMGKVDGRAKGLAVAAGRLFVSTDTGAIHSFGSADARRTGVVAESMDRSPYPHDRLTSVFEAAAETIVRSTNVTEGYCLVLGCGTGRLAFELAKRTELRIYGVEPDPDKVETARNALDATGLWGTRVRVHEGDLSALPYPDYFANLVVSEQILRSGLKQRPARPWKGLLAKKSLQPPAAKELFRVLKPHGGTAFIGQPAGARRVVDAVTSAELRAWVAGVSTCQIVEDRGTWLRITRGPLEGAGKWAHQYAEPGNTACSDDQIVKCPLGVLWFGHPGPHHMVNRHMGAASPLAINGRLFIQGENVVMAYDAYNGLMLWEREIDGAMRTSMYGDCSNLAASDDSFFVAAKDKCLRLDAATGQTMASYDVPAANGNEPRNWGYVARVGNLLYGSATKAGRTSDAIFAVDIETGKPQWIHRAGDVSHVTIAISGGRVLFTDRAVTDGQRRAAIAGTDGDPKKADVRLVVALDSTTGAKFWEKCVDLTDCSRVSAGGGELFAMCHDGVLVFCAASANGHYWRHFFAGEFRRRKVIALSAADGSVMWDKPVGYRIRPLIIGDSLVAEPWQFDLKTGDQKMREHPVTGEQVPWQFARPGHHCGCISANRTGLFFRSYHFGYYDLVGDHGTLHFGAQRPGCHINLIPANGLLMAPEASCGCMCPFPNMCTVVFKPRKKNRAWAMFSSPGAMTPVKHLAINLGAPGDRRDRQGTLWLAYPRPYKGRLVVELECGVESNGYFRRDPESIQIDGTDTPWLFASGGAEIAKCTVPLIDRGQPPATYTVHLGFVELANDGPGQRVFDVKLQRNVVLEGFDVFAAAGGQNRAIVKGFKNVEVRGDLTIELVPRVKDATAKQSPVLCSIEATRTSTLGVDIVAGELKEPMEVYNLGYWYADFIREQTAADVVLVPSQAIWSDVESCEAGPVTLGKLFAWIEDRRVVSAEIRGQDLIHCLNSSSVVDRLNPYCPRRDPLPPNVLYHSGLKVTYDVAAATAGLDLAANRVYTVAYVWPFDDASAYSGDKPPLEDTEKAEPILGLKAIAKMVLPASTWDLFARESKLRKFQFTKRHPKPDPKWEAWKKQIQAAVAAREKAELEQLAKRFAKEIVLAGGIKWRLVAADDFERPALSPNWKTLQGKWTVKDGRLRSSGTSFLGCATKMKAPVRIEFDGRQKDPCDLSSFWGTAHGTYQDGYFIGFGANSNTRNKILKMGEEVVGTNKGPLIVANRWHHVIAQVLPTKVQLIVDGKLVLDYVDPAPVKAADTAGIITWYDAEIDNLRIYTGE